MTTPSSSSTYFLIVATSLFLISITSQPKTWPTSLPLRFDSKSITRASSDFGKMEQYSFPSAVLYPSSPADIETLIRLSYTSPNPFTISARGRGHSVRGQAFARGGVVVEMAALGENMHGRRRINMSIGGPHRSSYVDVGGEQMWINVLHETLKYGLAPVSWTDYLYLTVGGTLSNAGVSGQTFRRGPQISNVYEMDVITGTGETVTCSEDHNEDLFLATLGGLGQFGIITRARIALESAPQRVRWLRLLYTDFVTFTTDQERLIIISSPSSSSSSDDGVDVLEKKMDRMRRLDYVEGSLLMDHTIISSWRSSFFSAKDLERISILGARHGTLYCLEASLYYDEEEVRGASSVDQELESLLEVLNFVPGFAFINDVPYLSFLDRVREGELKLRSKGMWDVPHPWLNVFIPKSRILDFDLGVFKGILKHNISVGPILVYPTNKNKWDERMSAVIPDEEIFYSVGLLRSAVDSNWKHLEDQNNEILQFCDQVGIQFKEYLPRYRVEEEWRKHFGSAWDKFVQRKQKYDPKAILSPGQGIFTSPLVHFGSPNLTMYCQVSNVSHPKRTDYIV